MFRMNWYDFKNQQIQYKGTVYPLITKPRGRNIRMRILFILNVHRGVFVDREDLIDFVYGEMDPDAWPDYQIGSIRATILRLRLLLPPGVIIINSHSYGYKLEVEGEV